MKSICAVWAGSHIYNKDGSYSFLKWEDGQCIPKQILCECEKCKIKREVV